MTTVIHKCNSNYLWTYKVYKLYLNYSVSGLGLLWSETMYYMLGYQSLIWWCTKGYTIIIPRCSSLFWETLREEKKPVFSWRAIGGEFQ